ncbi:MAG: hypothetical protein R2710_15020 [Acidimicrobiales bacterium]
MVRSPRWPNWIGGYYLLDAPDLDTVIELCRILPAYDIDIRPVLDAP